MRFSILVIFFFQIKDSFLKNIYFPIEISFSPQLFSLIPQVLFEMPISEHVSLPSILEIASRTNYRSLYLDARVNHLLSQLPHLQNVLKIITQNGFEN